MPDCKPTGERRSKDTGWKYVGAFPLKAELINGVFSHQTVYVWQREFEREFVCECADPPAKENIWVDGNFEFYQFKLIGELDDVLRVGPIGSGVPAGLRPAFDPVAGEQGEYDPTLWWGPSALPYIKEPPPQVVSPGSDNDPNVGGTVLAKAPTVDCAHRKVRMPDGSAQDFMPDDPAAVHDAPVTPVSPPMPWEERFNNCCSALQPQDRIPKVELIDAESCVFKESGTWYFNGHIKLTHPCGIGDVSVQEFILHHGTHTPISPPLHPGRGKITYGKADGQGIDYEADVIWDRQNVSGHEPRGVVLVVTATSRCVKPAFHGSFTINRRC